MQLETIEEGGRNSGGRREGKKYPIKRDEKVNWDELGNMDGYGYGGVDWGGEGGVMNTLLVKLN